VRVSALQARLAEAEDDVGQLEHRYTGESAHHQKQLQTANALVQNLSKVGEHEKIVPSSARGVYVCVYVCVVFCVLACSPSCCVRVFQQLDILKKQVVVHQSTLNSVSAEQRTFTDLFKR
jgi:hypothetical protein